MVKRVFQFAKRWTDLMREQKRNEKNERNEANKRVARIFESLDFRSD